MNRSIVCLTFAVAISGCPPVADLGVYTASETDSTGGPGGGETTGGGEASAPTSSGGESTGSTTDAGESTAGLSGETEAPGSTSGGTSTGAGTSTGGSTGGETSGGETSGGETSSGSSSASSSGSSSASSSGSSSGGGEPVCGDMFVDAPEQCDDGDDDEWDGCQSDCTFGPGKQLKQLELIGKAEGEQLCCLAAVADPFVEGETHALVVGGYVVDFLPDQIAAHVEMVPIPAGGAALWSYLEVAGMYGRMPGPMATAANGDVIVAGQVYTEQQQVDSGGYLWLVRFAPDGQIVWSREYADLYIRTEGIALTPDGEVVIAGRSNGFTNIAPDVHKFASDGAWVWTYHEPDALDYASSYGGVAVDEVGTIYVAGTQFDYDEPEVGRTTLRGLSPAGALLWAEEHVAPIPRTTAMDLVLTVDDALLLAGTQYAEEAATDAIVVGAFDTSGGLKWWQPWTPTPGWRANAGRMIEAADGGVYVGGRTYLEANFDHFVIRLDAQGDPLWSRVEPGEAVEDLVLAPDGLLYALTREAILQYLP